MEKKQYVLGVDLGTTSAKSVIMDLQGNAVGIGQLDNPLTYYKNGFAEIDGPQMIENIYATTRMAIEQWNGDPKDIIGISFCMFRSTMVMRTADGGFAVPISIWQDLRGGEMLDWEAEQIPEKELYDNCGMPNYAANPSARLFWYMKNNPEAYAKTTDIHTMQGFLTKAYGADDYYDDLTCSPYMQMNGHDFEYKKELCDAFGVDIEKLAPLKKSLEIIGHVTEEVAAKTGLAVGTPLVMGTGDQQCGTLGTGVVDSSVGYTCGGTAGLSIVNSDEFIRDPNGKCYVLGTPAGQWCIEGLSNNAGSAYKWVKQVMCTSLAVQAAEQGKDIYDLMSELAESAGVGAHGVMFLNYLSGATTPNNNVNARGCFLGMTMASDKADFIRAALEGVVFDLKDMFDAILDAGVKDFDVVRTTGGLARSDLFNQIQADVYNKAVETVAVEEGTGIGCGIMAAVGVGAYPDLKTAAENMVKVVKRYEPIPENVEKYKVIYDAWRQAYKSINEGGTFDDLAMIQKMAQ